MSFIYTVPTAAPQNVTGEAQSSTEVMLSWEPPPIQDQNGVIRVYVIRVTDLTTGIQRVEYQYLGTNYTVSSLHPHYRYQFAVAADTVGVGPYSSPIEIQTLQDG